MRTSIEFMNLAAAQWLDAVWCAAWQIALTVVVVWALCLVVKRLTGRVRAWLWGIVYVKLMIALLGVFSVDLPVLAPSPENRTLDPPEVVANPRSARSSESEQVARTGIEPATRLEARPVLEQETRALEPAGKHRTPHAAIAVEPFRASRLTPAAWLLLVWTVGVGAVGWQQVRSHRRIREIAQAASPLRDDSLRQMVREVAASLRMGVLPGSAPKRHRRTSHSTGRGCALDRGAARSEAEPSHADQCSGCEWPA